MMILGGHVGMEGPPGKASTFTLLEVKTTTELTSVLLLSLHFSLFLVSLNERTGSLVRKAAVLQQPTCPIAYKSGNAHMSDAAGYSSSLALPVPKHTPSPPTLYVHPTELSLCHQTHQSKVEIHLAGLATPDWPALSILRLDLSLSRQAHNRRGLV